MFIGLFTPVKGTLLFDFTKQKEKRWLILPNSKEIATFGAHRASSNGVVKLILWRESQLESWKAIFERAAHFQSFQMIPCPSHGDYSNFPNRLLWFMGVNKSQGWPSLQLTNTIKSIVFYLIIYFTRLSPWGKTTRFSRETWTSGSSTEFCSEI